MPVLHNVALLLALSDLVRDPAHWRKTDHGAAVRGVTADCSHYVLAKQAVSSDPLPAVGLLVALPLATNSRGCTSALIELERTLTQKESQ